MTRIPVAAEVGRARLTTPDPGQAAAHRSPRTAAGPAGRQRTYGNRYVQRMLDQAAPAAGTQAAAGPEVIVGPADDHLEREADRTAHDVLRRSPAADAPASGSVGSAGSVGGSIAEIDVAQSLARQRGTGRPLAGAIRHDMERAFGTGFGGVRVHADAAADRLATALGARAFTTGNDIYFRGGAYGRHPGATELLAHELTHVVQQRRGAGGVQRCALVQRKIGMEIETKIPMRSQARGNLGYKDLTFVDFTGNAAGRAAKGADQFHIEADTANIGEANQHSIAEFVTGAFDTEAEFSAAVFRLYLFLRVLRRKITSFETPLPEIVKDYRDALRPAKLDLDQVVDKDVVIGGVGVSGETALTGKPQVTFGSQLGDLGAVVRALKASRYAEVNDTAVIDAAIASAQASVQGDLFYEHVLDDASKRKVTGFLTLVHLLIRMAPAAGGAHRPHKYSKAAFPFLPRVNLRALHQDALDVMEQMAVDTALVALQRALPPAQRLVPRGFQLGTVLEPGPTVGEWVGSIQSPATYPLTIHDQLLGYQTLVANCSKFELKMLLELIFPLLAIYGTYPATSAELAKDFATMDRAPGVLIDAQREATRQLEDFTTDYLDVYAPAPAVAAREAVLNRLSNVDLMARGSMKASSGSLGAWGARPEGAVLEYRQMALVTTADRWLESLMGIFHTVESARTGVARDPVTEAQRVNEMRGAADAALQAVFPHIKAEKLPAPAGAGGTREKRSSSIN